MAAKTREIIADDPLFYICYKHCEQEWDKQAGEVGPDRCPICWEVVDPTYYWDITGEITPSDFLGFRYDYSD